MTWLVVRDGFLQHWWFVVAFYSISGSRWLFTALVVRDGFLQHYANEAVGGFAGSNHLPQSPSVVVRDAF